MATHPRLQGDPIHTGTWWTCFQDPILNDLIATTSSQNLTLLEAGQRVLEARARRGVVAGNLFPQTQAMTGSYTKARISPNTANFFAFPGVFDPDLHPENWAIGPVISWELDFWGRYRRAIESADASLAASIAAYDDALVVLLAEVAATYTELRTYEARLALAKQNLDIQEQTLLIVRQKHSAGLANGIDVGQAESNYGQTAAVLPDLEIARRQASNRLCVLLGRTPVDLEPQIGFTSAIPHPPHNIATGIPADLVRRRPDIRRAERDLAAQSAKIGIAESDFYPHISLTGNIGFASQDIGNLIQSSSAVGAITPQFSWNILNYGRIRNNVQAEKAAFQSLVFAYQQSVLLGLQEAEDAQIAYVYKFDQADALTMAVKGAREAVDNATKLYQAGSIDFGRVYVLQAELVRQQDRLAVTEGEIAESLIDIFKAIGGGWESHQTCVAMESAATTIR